MDVRLSPVYKSYESTLLEKGDVLVKSLTSITTLCPSHSITSQTFNFSIAEFTLRLSKLAYEDSTIIQRSMQLWGAAMGEPNGLQYLRFGHEECSVLIVWSVVKGFVVVAFKGTSPFNLTEWVLDMSLQKVAVKNGILPGALHMVSC